MRSARVSRIGRREENQDAACVECTDNCVVAGVFDGLGGHSGGKMAASHACAAAAAAEGSPSRRLAAANRAVLNAQERTGMEDMRTTGVLLTIDGSDAMWAHCGDSRLYLVRNGKVSQLTYDHSVPQALVRRGEITQEQVRFHEDRSRLTRALGSIDMRSDAGEGNALPGDVFILMSDGFWEPVDEEMIECCVESSSGPEELLAALERLVERAQDVHQDNYTAVAVWL